MTILEVMATSTYSRTRCLAAVGRSAARDADGPDRRLSRSGCTLDDIYDPGRARQLQRRAGAGDRVDRRRPLRLGRAGDRGGGDWLKVDAADGIAAPLFDAAKMEAALAELPGVDADEARPARPLARSLTFNRRIRQPSCTIGGRSLRYSFDDGRAARLTNAAGDEEQAYVQPGRSRRSPSSAATTCSSSTSRPAARRR